MESYHKTNMNIVSNKLSIVLEQHSLSLTEAAAIACFNWIGKGQEKAADQAAVTAMRQEFNTMPIDGCIVIGEGERDEAPMLFIGEKVGLGGDAIDIAVDPLEGTTICAHGKAGSISVLALAPRGTLLHAPDVYMDKIAVGSGLPDNIIDLDNSPKQNLLNLAKAKKCSVSELTACVLIRERHEELIAKIREAGARIHLIDDGDVFGIIALTQPKTGIDIYMGSGGAPEGVLAAAALTCMGGAMQGRLLFKEETQKERGRKLGIQDLNFKYSAEDMVRSDVIFSATGVTDGWMLKGVKKTTLGWKLHSLVSHRISKSIKFIETYTTF